MNIYDLFEDALQRAAERPALIEGIGKTRRIVSFAELEKQVNGVVTTLNKRGLRAGDKVLLAVPVSIDTYVVMLALLKAGLVIMHIDPARRPRGQHPHRASREVLADHHAAARLHDEQLLRVAGVGETPGQAVEVAGDPRREVGVHHRGAGALELRGLGHHLMGERQIDLRQDLAMVRAWSSLPSFSQLCFCKILLTTDFIASYKVAKKVIFEYNFQIFIAENRGINAKQQP